MNAFEAYANLLIRGTYQQRIQAVDGVMEARDVLLEMAPERVDDPELVSSAIEIWYEMKR